MQKELLPPNLIIKELEERLEQLKHVLAYKKKLQNNEIPPGHLRIAQISKTPQYYHYTNPKDFNGKYIPSSQKKFIKQLAQKDYDTKVIKVIEKEIEATQQYLLKTQYKANLINNKSYSQTKLCRLYTKLHPARQQLVTPVTLTDEQYAEQWQRASWQGRSFSDDLPAHTTSKGERVRSKSEVLIADTLYRLKIPYRYEYPLEIKRYSVEKYTQSITFHPDFICLNVRTRKEFFWEHFGLMDNLEYAQKAAGKLRLYAENNIIPGQNLIITMETQAEPLVTQFVERLIKTFLL